EPISRSHPSQVAIHHVGQNTEQGYFYYVMDLADDANAESRPGTSGGASYREPAFPNPLTTPASCNSALQSQISNLKSQISNPDLYLPKTLKHLLRTRGRLPFAECLDIALALTTALEHLHGHGLVHRDIKPSNVIFVDGVPKLADIGLVTSIDATQSFVGTEGFFPPEGPGTAQADIFSLGKLLYEIATGKDRREFPELPADLATPEEQAELSELNAIILKACQHDPEKRHASASALREELERLQRGRSVKRHRAWQRRWDRVRKLALPAALGIVGAMALAALWRLQSGAEAKTESPEARANLADQGTSTGLDPRAIFILPIRPAETNGVPLDLCSRITDAFIDSLGLLTNQGITVGPRKSGWAHLAESEQFQRVTNEFRMRHALTGKVRLADDQYALTLGWWDLELGQPRWTETFRGGTNELVELERQALMLAARTFDINLTPDQDRQISQLLTNNLEALGYYREAKKAYAAQGAILLGSVAAQRLTQPALRLVRIPAAFGHRFRFYPDRI
ncbi:MAG: protein kinase, partial [Verrucomicrobia bacterium]|nr:protein kinase [Verrucomicrobiota bacterium]